MPDEKFREIALFRYGIIAPVLYETCRGQRKYFRQMSRKEFDVPYLGRRRFKPDTFKGWLRDYRIGGIDALYPKERSDKGGSRKIDEKLGQVIRGKMERFPFLSCASLYRLLISEGEMNVSFLSEATLMKYLKDNNLRMRGPDPVPRKKFEKEHINELWISDCMHGPSILHNNKKRQVFLISVIDDCSRVIVGSRFFFHENSPNLETVLKEAIMCFGLTKVFYCDNGALFVSSHLQLACARLGIALVHSKPYDSPSRGKIERWHRTIRQKFLPFINPSQIESIEELNAIFSRWLDKEYQKCFHYGIGAKPMDKWMDELRHTPIKRVTAQELDRAFHISIKRKVKNDATVSVHGILYEVPPSFIGKKIEIRYPSDKPEELMLYENDKPVCSLKRLNPHENANPPAWGIKFDQEADKDV